ncbi:MAG: hypothetical protein KAS32_20285 [Candidatus Peribacteraceae bacterium]|nr:hypothetical protein [Candidatus Peribacteraceae bacterium]
MKNPKLSVGEQGIVSELQRNFGITEIEATDHVFAQKRELAFIHHNKGNFELSRQLMIEMDEWTEEAEKDYQKWEQCKTKKIIVL